jgi:general secretion pathway protein D
MSAFPKSHTRLQGWIKGRLGFIAMLLVVTVTATGQTAEGSVAPLNFRDADFVKLVEAVSAATGKSFIIDRRIHARVTMISSTKMSPSAFYDAFLALLPVCGFVTKTEGPLVIILPDPNAAGFIRISQPYHSSCSPGARWE